MDYYKSMVIYALLAIYDLVPGITGVALVELWLVDTQFFHAGA